MLTKSPSVRWGWNGVGVEEYRGKELGSSVRAAFLLTVLQSDRRLGRKFSAPLGQTNTDMWQ